jgi:hypothetical protein
MPAATHEKPVEGYVCLFSIKKVPDTKINCNIAANILSYMILQLQINTLILPWAICKRDQNTKACRRRLMKA